MGSTHNLQVEVPDVRRTVSNSKLQMIQEIEGDREVFNDKGVNIAILGKIVEKHSKLPQSLRSVDFVC